MTGPTEAQLRAAGAQLRVDRLHADLEASLMGTCRGRLAWRMAGLLSRIRRSA
jgi:hypothetical protein